MVTYPSKLWLNCKCGWVKTEHTWSSYANTLLIVEFCSKIIQVLIHQKFGVSLFVLRHRNPQHIQQARVNYMRGQYLGLYCISQTCHSASWCCQVHFGGFLRVYWELTRMIWCVGSMCSMEWVHVNFVHELSRILIIWDCKSNLKFCEDGATH